MKRCLPALFALLSFFLLVSVALPQNEDKMTSVSGVVFGAYKEGSEVKFATRGGAIVVDGKHVITSLSSCCGKTKSGVQTIPGVYVGGKLQAGKVLWNSTDLDLAIVEVDDDLGRTGAPVAPADGVRESQAVYTVQFDDADKPPQVSSGTIQGTAKMDSGAILFKTNAALNKGNDGGGLFDACGNIVGATYTFKEGVMYAVTSAPILQGLQASGVRAKVATEPCGGGASAAKGKSTASKAKEGGKEGGKEEGGEEEDTGRKWRLPRGTEWIPVVLLIAVIALAFRPAKRALTTKRRDPVPEPAPYPYQPAAYQPAPYQPAQYPQAGGGYPQQAPAPQYPGQPFIVPTPPVAAPTKPVLRGIAGQYAGTSVALDVSPGVLGRDPKMSNLVFTSEALSVSKRHCSVRWDASRNVFVLEDHGSTNGTFLSSGERLAPNQPRDLHPGDKFYIGDLRNQFEVGMES